MAFHDVTCSIRKEEKRRRGRPSKNDSTPIQEYKYFVDVIYSANEQKVTEAINQASYFVLCSNDAKLRGETILREYKTQDSVEKKYQQLK